MAFVPSIGDVLVAIQLVNDVYQKTVNAPGELQAAVNDVRDMRVELESMKCKVGDENSFIKKNGGIMLATITHTFEPLKEDLRGMKHLVREYNKIPPFSPQKIIFGCFKIPEVKKIQENFNNYRAIYSRAFEHVGAEADAQNAAELKAVNKKLETNNKQLARDIIVLKKQQKESIKIQKANDAKMDKLLSLLEQMKTPVTPGSPSQPKSKADLEKKLLESGLSNEEVKVVMGPMIFASQDSQLDTPKIIVGPSGNGKGDGKAPGQLNRNKSLSKLEVLEPPAKAPGRSRSVSGKQGQNKDNSPPRRRRSLALLPKDEGSKSASSEPTGLKAKAPITSNKDLKVTIPTPNKGAKKAQNHGKKDREKINILCIDRTNGVHSALARTYLELLRLWTANSSDPNSPRINWLFARASTRDLSIATDLTAHPSLSPPVAHLSPLTTANTASKPSPMRVITALTAPSGYFCSLDYPFEKLTLVSRIEGELRSPLGLRRQDFEHNDYLLCFDSFVKEDLHRLQAIVDEKDINTDPKADPPSQKKAKATIIYLPNTSWYISSTHTSVTALNNFISDMRTSIKSFATQHLNWERPHCAFQNGAFRTIYLVLTTEQLEAISAAVVGNRLGEMRKATLPGVKEMQGVSVGLAFEKPRKPKRPVVWITVPKEKVKAAKGWVDGLLAEKPGGG